VQQHGAVSAQPVAQSALQVRHRLVDLAAAAVGTTGWLLRPDLVSQHGVTSQNILTCVWRLEQAGPRLAARDGAQALGDALPSVIDGPEAGRAPGRAVGSDAVRRVVETNLWGQNMLFMHHEDARCPNEAAYHSNSRVKVIDLSSFKHLLF
jgi:hypothetical protein